MRQLKALKTLAEAKMPSVEESSRRKKLDQIEKLVLQLEANLEGNTLKKILEDGGFPATESKAMIKKFNAFQDEFSDFQMALLQEFDDK